MLSIPQLQQLYSTEKVALVLLSRLYFGTESIEQVQNYMDSSTIDWTLLYKISRAHHVRSFIYHTITTRKLKVDADFEARLKQDAIDISLQNLHQLHFTKQLLSDFSASSIKVIPYKGVNFGQKYYESVAIRESSDIDLLVDRKSVKQIRAYFHDREFLAKDDVPDGYLKYALLFFKELVFKTNKDKANINCSVEVQWRLIDPYIGKFVDFRYFEQQAANSTGNTVSNLTATNDMICLASHHFIREPLTRFKYVIDAACLLQKAGATIDHQLIMALLKTYNYQNFYGVALQTIYDLLGIGLDNATLNATEQSKVVLLNSSLAFPPVKKISPLNSPNLKLIWNQHNLRGKATLGLRMLAYSFLPSAYDINELKLPAYLLPLIVVLRPFRFFGGLWAKNKTA